MRVLVCGSRYFNDMGLLTRVLDNIRSNGGIETIIEGEARGADSLAREYAEIFGIRIEKFPADWNKHGKAAGPIRNIQMLKEGKPDKVIAFLAPNSRGTAHMIKIAEEAGIPVKVINI